MGRIGCISCIIVIVCIPIGVIAVRFAFVPIQGFTPPPRPEFISFGVLIACVSLVLRCTCESEGPPAVDTQSHIELSLFSSSSTPENILVHE